MTRETSRHIGITCQSLHYYIGITCQTLSYQFGFTCEILFCHTEIVWETSSYYTESIYEILLIILELFMEQRTVPYVNTILLLLLLI